MKLASGNVQIKGQRLSAFIQAKTKKRMVEMLNEHTEGYFSMNHFRNYWYDSGNSTMHEMAGDQEGLWVAPDKYSQWKYNTYKKIA